MTPFFKKIAATLALSTALWMAPLTAAPAYLSQTSYPTYYMGSSEMSFVRSCLPYYTSTLVDNYTCLYNYQVFPSGEVVITPYASSQGYYISVTCWDSWGKGYAVFRFHNKYNGIFLYEYTITFDDYYDMYPTLFPIFATDRIANAVYLHAILDTILQFLH